MHGSADVLHCLSFDVCSWLCGICCVLFVARCLFVCLLVNVLFLWMFVCLIVWLLVVGRCLLLILAVCCVSYVVVCCFLLCSVLNTGLL